ncbi:MAG: hypothetical protein ACYS18_07445 [Planctomycetota bacterium]|jgi:hypothetical protein
MPLKQKLKHILVELKGHIPFTLLGAMLGVLFMLIFKNIDKPHAATLFSIFHPGHVVLSAMVTASMFSLHRKAKNFLLILLVGYVGSIGIATFSDSVVPYMGGRLFGLHVPAHTELHSHGDHDHASDEINPEHRSKLHVGFIEDWYIVNPAAVLGVLIAYFVPRTKFPHAFHVLISTWASSSFLLMNIQNNISLAILATIFGILFVAVWVPCCVSDIIFPLFFVKSDLEIAGPCPAHGCHSHPHVDKLSEDDNESTD